jgi:glycosyltransferase involved in cell wall biosynthesis
VVPTCRRPALLRRCLGQLVAQEFDAGAYEILVADDGLDSRTRTAVEEVAARYPRPALRYVPVGMGRGPAAARNRAWRRARGAVIAFTDDDCVPAPDWLARGLSRFRPGVAAVAGRVIMPLPRRPTDYEANAAGLERASFVTANCFCRREALAAVGGFDERFRRAWREDSDLFFTLLERGAQVVAEPDAVVVHPVRPGRWGVSLRQQQNALFEALLYKKHPALYWSRGQTRRPWHYYAILAASGGSLAGLLRGSPAGWIFGGIWVGLTGVFCARRLARTSRHPAHVLEMALTSALIPWLACFWRLAGALRYRVLFF